MRQVESLQKKGARPARTTQQLNKRRTPFFCLEKGFTLLETAIALMIIALVSASLLFTVYKCLSIIQTSRDINVAVSDARTTAEALRQEADNDISAVISSSSNIGHINSSETVATTINVSQTPAPANITVNWQGEKNRQRSVIIDMFLTQRN